MREQSKLTNATNIFKMPSFQNKTKESIRNNMCYKQDDKSKQEKLH